MKNERCSTMLFPSYCPKVSACFCFADFKESGAISLHSRPDDVPKLDSLRRNRDIVRLPPPLGVVLSSCVIVLCYIRVSPPICPPWFPASCLLPPPPSNFCIRDDDATIALRTRCVEQLDIRRAVYPLRHSTSPSVPQWANHTA